MPKYFLTEVPSENMKTPTSNDQVMIEEKPTCKDKLTEKKCKKLKKKNKGNGCKKENTKNKCKKTCGLCSDGKLSIIGYSAAHKKRTAYNKTLGK